MPATEHTDIENLQAKSKCGSSAEIAGTAVTYQGAPASNPINRRVSSASNAARAHFPDNTSLAGIKIRRPDGPVDDLGGRPRGSHAGKAGHCQLLPAGSRSRVQKNYCTADK
jgi:hypothetical protein